jgi:hypothetical protein
MAGLRGKSDMQHTSRLAALAELEARIAHAEAVARRHRQAAAQAARGSDEARRATGLLRVAQERLEQLERSKDVLMAGDEGREEEFEVIEAGERQPAPAAL